MPQRDPITGKFVKNPNSKAAKKAKRAAAPVGVPRMPQEHPSREPVAPPPPVAPPEPDREPSMDHGSPGDGDGVPVTEAPPPPPLGYFNPPTEPPPAPATEEGGDDDSDDGDTSPEVPIGDAEDPTKVPVNPTDSGDMIAAMVTAAWDIYVQMRHPYVHSLPPEQAMFFQVTEKEHKRMAKAGALWAKHNKVRVSPEANLVMAIAQSVGPKAWQAEMFRKEMRTRGHNVGR